MIPTAPIAAVSHAIELNPQNAYALAIRSASLRQMQGKLEEAIADIDSRYRNQSKKDA